MGLWELERAFMLAKVCLCLSLLLFIPPCSIVSMLSPAGSGNATPFSYFLWVYEWWMMVLCWYCSQPLLTLMLISLTSYVLLWCSSPTGFYFCFCIPLFSFSVWFLRRGVKMLRLFLYWGRENGKQLHCGFPRIQYDGKFWAFNSFIFFFFSFYYNISSGTNGFSKDSTL